MAKRKTLRGKMTVKKTLEEEADLRRDVIELSVRMEHIIIATNKLQEVQEGTLRTHGLRDRLILAENDIKLNKDAWQKTERSLEAMNTAINTTIQESYTELQKEFTRKMDDLIVASRTQQTWINKVQPYFNVIAWLVTAAAGIILSQVLSGKWYVGPTP